MASLKVRIQRLRRKGNSYLDIASSLGCSKATISYHLGNGVKAKQMTRQWRNRTKATQELKRLHGGKCSVCGYSKCLSALEFHHKDPSQKKRIVSDKDSTLEERMTEAKKCVLLCANCHREFHAGLITL